MSTSEGPAPSVTAQSEACRINCLKFAPARAIVFHLARTADILMMFSVIGSRNAIILLRELSATVITPLPELLKNNLLLEDFREMVADWATE